MRGLPLNPRLTRHSNMLQPRSSSLFLGASGKDARAISIYLYLSIYPSFQLSVFLPIYLSMSIYLYLSICFYLGRTRELPDSGLQTTSAARLTRGEVELNQSEK